MMKIKVITQLAETRAQYGERIRIETRRKILKNSKPINLDGLKRSMAIDEPTHLGNLSKVRMLAD